METNPCGHPKFAYNGSKCLKIIGWDNFNQPIVCGEGWIANNWGKRGR